MVFWRISRHRDLSGAGGLRAPGRWHHAGHPIVYLAESPAAALLEVCAHTSADDVPPEFTLLRIEGPGREIRVVQPKDLSLDWATRLEITRDMGTKWLRRRETALLRVPSAIVPATTNFLLNPLHTDATKFSVVDTFSYPFDLRLKR